MRGGILAALTATASVAAGAPISELYPIVDFYYANDYRAHPMCEEPSSDEFPSVSINPVTLKARAWPYRTSVGLRQLSRELMTLYGEEFANRSASDIKYVAAARRKHFDWESVKKNALAIALGRGLTEGEAASIPDAICDSFVDSVKDEFFCYAAGNFSVRTSCLQQYEYEDVEVATRELKEFESDWPIDGECFTPLTPAHQPLQFQLQLFGAVPSEIDASTAFSESKTYYAAWRAMERVERYGEQQYLVAPSKIGQKVNLKTVMNDTEVFDSVLPGWETERVWWAHELWAEDQGYIRIPLAVMSRRTGSRDLLFVVRRPLTNYEQRAAWENQLTGIYLYGFPGGIHDGSGNWRGQMHATFMKYIRDWFYEVKNAGKQDFDSITFVGADFPGIGIAAGLAVNTRQMRESVLGPFARTKVNLITFGNPYYGDRELATYIRNNINARHIQIEGDGTQPLPCRTNRACDERHLITRTGTVTGTRALYDRAPGYFRIPLSELGKMNSTWARPEAALQLAAIRDCGYACGLGLRACKSDPWAQHNCNECESWIDM